MICKGLIKESIENAQKLIPSIGTENNPLILGNAAFWMDEDKIKFDIDIMAWDIPAWTNDVMYWIRLEK